MSQTVIDLVLLAAAALFGAASVRSLLAAWRSGTIKASGDRVFNRATQPGAFWGHVIFEAVIALVALAAVVVVGVRMVGKA